MRILVLGGAGMVGHKMWQVLNADFPAVNVVLHKARGFYEFTDLFPDPTRVHDRIDVTDETKLFQVLRDVRPSVICNCIGLTWRKDAGSTAERYIRLNSLLPHQLNTWCMENNARLMTFSTDCVFSGETGSYTEESPPDARHIYGRTKALGEVISPCALALRTSVIGREIESRTELLEWFISQNGKSIKGFRQAFYSGVTTLYLAQTVSRLIRDFPDLNGLYQIASATIRKSDLLRLIRQHFQLHIDIEDDDSQVVRKDLIGTKFAHRTGIQVPDWETLIADLAADPTPYPSGRFPAQ